MEIGTTILSLRVRQLTDEAISHFRNMLILLDCFVATLLAMTLIILNVGCNSGEHLTDLTISEKSE